MAKTVLVWLGVCIACAAAGGQTAQPTEEGPRPYHNAERGFSLTIPAEWTEVPTCDLEELLRQAAPSGLPEDVSWDLMLQQAGADGVPPPYVIVQTVPYGPTGPPSETGMARAAEQLRDIHARRSSTSLEEIGASPKDRTFVFEIVGDARGVGPVRTRVYGHFGAERIAMVMCCAGDEDFERYRAMFGTIDGSFAFEPGYEYTGPRRRGLMSEESFEALYKGVTALCILACIIYVVGRRGRSRHRSAGDALPPPPQPGS